MKKQRIPDKSAAFSYSFKAEIHINPQASKTSRYVAAFL